MLENFLLLYLDINVNIHIINLYHIPNYLLSGLYCIMVIKLYKYLGERRGVGLSYMEFSSNV